VEIDLAETRLPNGLRVLVVPQRHLYRAHVALWVRIGSRFETKETNGLSHFLEHMLYRGTPRLPNAHAVNLAFESVGGYLHAVTHADHGVFSVTFPEGNLDAVVPLFAEALTQPMFRDIEIEKGIVCEEILEDLDDEGRQVDADNLSRALIYKDHPLGFTITGDEKRVRSFGEKALRAHHLRHYNAQSSVLVLAGNIDPKRAFDVAARAFESLPRGKRVTSPAPVHAQKRARLRIVPNASSQTELRVCFRAIAETDPDRAALDVMMRVIDDGMSTRLYHRICDAQGLCYDVSAGYDGYEDDGVIDFAAGVQHDRAARVAGEILSLMDELAREGPTEEELDKAKRRSTWETHAMRDSAEEAAAFFGRAHLLGIDHTPEERLASTLAVTRDDVVRVARTIARPERLNVVAVGLIEGGDDTDLSRTITGWRGAREEHC
jgi:predicted Zn-dependent peptidase